VDAGDGGEQRREASALARWPHGLNTSSNFNGEEGQFSTAPTAVRVPPAVRREAGAATLVAADRLQLRVVGRRVVEDGASRARAAARLGAIQALSCLESLTVSRSFEAVRRPVL
jgi:hypothetical protein